MDQFLSLASPLMSYASGQSLRRNSTLFAHLLHLCAHLANRIQGCAFLRMYGFRSGMWISSGIDLVNRLYVPTVVRTQGLVEKVSD